MVRRWPGNTCAAARTTGTTGPARALDNAALRRPAGGCDFVEDPRLDARQVRPLWDAGTDDLLQVRPSGAAGGAQRFSLWQIPGIKRLSHAGDALILAVGLGPLRLQASLSSTLHDGTPYTCSVPLNAQLQTRLPAYQAQARVLHGERPRARFRPAQRSGLLHLRAIHALDAQQSGARHRDIALALFGAEAVASRWSADGELRAQVRHLLARGRGFVDGGYLALAGVRPGPVMTPGDEPGP